MVEWPTDLIAHTCDFRLQKNTTRFQSPITRTIQTLHRQGRRWVADYDFLFERERGQRLSALLDDNDTFLMWDHARPRPLGTNLDRSSFDVTYFNTPGSPGGITKFEDGGSPTVLTGFSGGDSGIRVWGNYAIGVDTVLADGFPTDTTQLLTGDYVELGGFAYMLVEDAEADSLGRAYLYLNRPLVAAVTHQYGIERAMVATPMILVDDDQNRRPVGGEGRYSMYPFHLSFVEDLT